MNVVIVGKFASCLQALKQRAQDLGANMIHAPAVDDGIRALDRLEAPPSLIILDNYGQPEDNERIISRIKAAPALSTVPIIFAHHLRDLHRKA